LVGVAVKVTRVPEQMVVAEADMLDCIGSRSGDGHSNSIGHAVAGDTQVPEGVMTQVTTSPLASVLDVYVLPVPTLVVPTFHW
jgi:hypothetical protein